MTKRLFYGLEANLSNTTVNETLSGFFTETGLMGMLGAADYNYVDVFSPFLGTISNRCCCCTEGAPTSTVFTKYVDLVNLIYQKVKVPG